MPISVIKVRYESNLYKYPSLYHSFKSTIQNEGIKGLFKGYSATILRDAPFAGIYVWSYEHSKKELKKHGN